jgi:hypothetical protein
MRFLPADFRSNLLPITLSQVIGMSCGVAGVKLMSQFVPPADYGHYAVFLTATPLGMWVSHAGLIKFGGRFWGASSARPQLLRELAGAFLRKLWWLALCAGAVAFVIDRGAWAVLSVLLFSIASLLALGALGQALLQSARENWRDFGVTSAGALTRTFLPPLFYVGISASTMSLYAGVGVHALVVAVATAWMLRRHRALAAAAPRQLTDVYEGPLFTFLALTGWAMAGLNRWVTAAFFGSAVTGYFTLASNIAMVAATLLSSVFMQYFQPGFFLARRNTASELEQLARRIDRAALGYWVFSLVGVIALRWVAPHFVGILIDEKYRAAIPFIIPAGFFLTAMLTGQFFHTLLLAGRREKACAPVDLSTAAVLAIGCVAAAACGGEAWFSRWLCLAPLVPWLLSRPLARHFFFLPSAESPKQGAFHA